jgi:hypothetical protein
MAGDASRENGKLGGRPKGSLEQATLDKRANAALVRQIVQKRLEPLVNAQIDNALGVSYLVLRDASGAYVRATDEAQVDAALERLNSGDESAVRFYTKEPHAGAASMLLAYAADKPVEPVEHSGPGGDAIPIEARLIAARKRIAGRE